MLQLQWNQARLATISYPVAVIEIIIERVIMAATMEPFNNINDNTTCNSNTENKTFDARRVSFSGVGFSTGKIVCKTDIFL